MPNGVTFGGYEESIVSGYRINVLKYPPGTSSPFGSSTQFILNPERRTLPTIYTNTFSFSEYADTGVRVFLVTLGQSFSLNEITSQSYTELDSSSLGYVFNSGSPFYLALYTGPNFAPPYPPYPPYQYLDPVFGWVKLQNFQGTIQFLDGALEYGGVGIYAGTQNIIAVPEPSALTLAALGSLLLGYRRWKKFS